LAEALLLEGCERASNTGALLGSSVAPQGAWSLKTQQHGDRREAPAGLLRSARRALIGGRTVEF
jgi:hypothetical protein